MKTLADFFAEHECTKDERKQAVIYLLAIRLAKMFDFIKAMEGVKDE